MNTYGLIFDMDGVLADTEAANAKASIRMFEDRFGLYGVQRKDFEAGLGRGAEAYILAAANIHGFSMTLEQLENAVRTRQEYFMEILRSEPLPPFPGVMPLIQEALEAQDVGLAIATSSTREKSMAVLAAAGIPYTKMLYLTGNDVIHKKPHPEIYLLTTERLYLDPGRCVVIEDAPEGIEAALAAGCLCIAVTHSLPFSKLQRAHRVIESLEDINLDTLRSWIERG